VSVAGCRVIITSGMSDEKKLMRPLPHGVDASTVAAISASAHAPNTPAQSAPTTAPSQVRTVAAGAAGSNSNAGQTASTVSAPAISNNNATSRSNDAAQSSVNSGGSGGSNPSQTQREGAASTSASSSASDEKARGGHGANGTDGSIGTDGVTSSSETNRRIDEVLARLATAPGEVDFSRLYEVLLLIAADEVALEHASALTAKGNAKTETLKLLLLELIREDGVHTLVALERGVDVLHKPE